MDINNAEFHADFEFIVKVAKTHKFKILKMKHSQKMYYQVNAGITYFYSVCKTFRPLTFLG
jgi:hypothetical protein